MKRCTGPRRYGKQDKRAATHAVSCRARFSTNSVWLYIDIHYSMQYDQVEAVEDRCSNSNYGSQNIGRIC
jgi:hypothetical protein